MWSKPCVREMLLLSARATTEGLYAEKYGISAVLFLSYVW